MKNRGGSLDERFCVALLPGIGLAGGLSKWNEGIGAAGDYASLANHAAFGGVLTVFALPG